MDAVLTWQRAKDAAGPWALFGSLLVAQLSPKEWGGWGARGVPPWGPSRASLNEACADADDGARMASADATGASCVCVW